MTIVMFEGFDYISDESDLNGRWKPVGSMVPSAIGTGRDGVGRFMTIQSAAASTYLSALTTDPGTSNSLIVGFAFKKGLSLNNDVLTFMDATDQEVLAIEILADGTFAAVNNTDQESVSTVAVTMGIWNYVEVKILFHASTGTVDWQINGAAAGNDTGASTIWNGTEVTSIRFRGASNPYHLYDDIYLATTAASGDFFGDTQVSMQLPNADTATVDFTSTEGSNYQAVDENPPDEDSTYNESTTTTHEDLFDFPTFGIPGTDTIHAVGINAWATKPSTGVVEMYLTALSVASTFTSPAINVYNGYLRFQGISLTDPNTAAAWTTAGLDAAAFGYKRV